MEKLLKIKKKQEVLSLINDIAFSCVPAWYGATMDNLKMSIICPKVRENHKKNAIAYMDLWWGVQSCRQSSMDSGNAVFC